MRTSVKINHISKDDSDCLCLICYLKIGITVKYHKGLIVKILKCFDSILTFSPSGGVSGEGKSQLQIKGFV